MSVTADEADLLAVLGARKVFVEIGTGLGVSTRALARHATWGSTIDPDPWVHEHVWPTVPVKVQTYDSWGTYLARQHSTPDLVFIDGSHLPRDLTHDIELARDTMTPRGMIVCHDAKILRPILDKSVGRWYHIDTYHGMAITTRTG